MKTMIRPRRSVLFVPAANQRALEKSRTLDADCVIYDLEDSVAAEAKSASRAALSAHFTAHPQAAFERIVRVNAADSEWHLADVEAVAQMGADAILLPKTEHPRSVLDVATLLDEHDVNPQMTIWAMIETARGILNADEIAELGFRAAARLDCLVVGPNDIARETGVKSGPGRPFLIPWLMQIVLAAKAGGLSVLDGVYNDFRDLEGFAGECEQAANMGFDGKTLIHPGQIAASNQAFSTSAAEIARAQLIVDSFAQPENAGKGVVSVNGQMVERLHLDMAQRVLARAALIAERTKS